MAAVLTRDGVRYRTRLLSLERAASFAKALGANHLFDGVTIERSRRAKRKDGWYVSFAPASPDRQARLLEQQLGQRAERGRELHFDWNSGLGCYLTDGSHGETYLVTTGSCSCADARYRMQGVCKHSLALLSQLEQGEVGQEEARELAVAERETVPVARPVVVRRSFEEIFGAR